MEKLKNKVAVITGSSRGIGRAIALRLAAEGAKVIVTATTKAGADKTADEIRQSGGQAAGFEANVADAKQVEALMKGTVDQFGALHILVNNAGVTRDNLVMRMSDEDWNAVITTNLTGTFNCIRAASKIMMKQRSGKIINITSIVALMGNKGQANYCAAKAGVIGLTKSVARELASRNIQVNAVAPGFILTDMTAGLPEAAKTAMLQSIPLERIGTPEDVAGVVAFLASPDSDYITGQVFNVDGGMVMA
ncbi:MAG: 3-oxoacyl-[acyl-carrier-protein] reductase [candidate division KSB1 bacterium]|nr:3-oxoacyl-[acyl-carrier-protein] reductase [candidate division KSB1 bacterium]MDZ7364665.1 3-oxoacyl-[acyl-carrier-protein] reductase [candidate division KSB1 bacterium]MDZ7402587.1 3-oxoacyl-[acyl-carrier-protein] reductase [candidate division KSB1 bacterium]